MQLKNAFLKLLDKLENVKISPVWGYSIAICLILYAIGLSIVQWDVHSGGGGYFLLWTYMSELAILAAIVLIVLTKKAKRYGAKISRIFSLAFLIIAVNLCHYIPSSPQMHGDCYFDPIDFVEYLVLIVAGFVGYAFGKYIAKKIENFNMASMKTESSQG